MDMTQATDETTDAPAEQTPPKWVVSLIMHFDAPDAGEAAKQFLDQTLEHGLRGFVYSVRDRTTDTLFFVEDGITYTQDEYDEKLDLEAQFEERLTRARLND